ncbi:hypothetical protein wCauATS_12850 [Wolbachia pipientis]
MSQVNRTNGLVDYKELETNILSSIREGRPLMGRDGALTPFIKRLLEASLEGEIEHHLSAGSEENNRRNGRNGKTLKTSAGSFELLTPRDREGSFEPQIVKKRQTSLHPELEAKVLRGMFKKVCQAAFLVQLNFQSVGKEDVKLRHS